MDFDMEREMQQVSKRLDVIRGDAPPAEPEGDAELAERARRSYLHECGFDDRYCDPVWDRVRPQSEVQAYLDGFAGYVQKGFGLMLVGPKGTGKTSIMAYIAQEARPAMNGRCRFVTAARLFDLLHTDDAQARVFHNCQLLMIDDWGSHYQSEWGLARCEALVESRYGAEMATIVSTNVDPADWKDKPEWERIRDRWRETCALVMVGGKSQRRAFQLAGGDSSGE